MSDDRTDELQKADDLVKSALARLSEASRNGSRSAKADQASPVETSADRLPADGPNQGEPWRLHVHLQDPQRSYDSRSPLSTNVDPGPSPTDQGNALPQPAKGSALGGSAYYISSMNDRDNNEDSYLLFELPQEGKANFHVLAIADGMGGYDFGELVSREALRQFGVSLFQSRVIDKCLDFGANRDGPERISDDLWKSLLYSGSHVKRMIETNNWSKAGTTLVACIVDDHVATVANVGDSPAFHFQKTKGSLYKITDDHTVAGALLKGGAISPEMARFHADRSKLEFYLGSGHPPKSPAVHEVRLEDGDVLLLCSDGLSSELAIEAMEACFVQEENLDKLAHQLLALSLEAKETDNQTAILYRCGTKG